LTCRPLDRGDAPVPGVGGQQSECVLVGLDLLLDIGLVEVGPRPAAQLVELGLKMVGHDGRGREILTGLGNGQPQLCRRGGVILRHEYSESPYGRGLGADCGNRRGADLEHLIADGPVHEIRGRLVG